MSALLRRLITALLLGVLVYVVYVATSGYQAIRASLVSFEWSAFGIAIALASFNYFLRFLRFRYYLGLLSVTGVSAADAFLVFLSGFVLTVTPGKVGEVFKSAVLQRTHGVPMERTAPTVIVERLSDLVGVVVLILLGSVGFSSGLPWALAGTGAVAVGFVLILWPPPMDALLAFMTRHPRLSRHETKVREAVRSLRLLAGPRAILTPLVLSVVAWASEGFALFVLLRGFGVSAPLLLSVFFYETASLAGALIPLPGGLGVVETMLREQLVRLGGIPVSVATSSMILVRFATLWWAVLVGFIALAVLRSRYPELGAEDVAHGKSA